MELIRQLLGEIIWFVMCWLWSYPQIWGLDKIFGLVGWATASAEKMQVSPLRCAPVEMTEFGLG
jgi:hypothetical protein